MKERRKNERKRKKTKKERKKEKKERKTERTEEERKDGEKNETTCLTCLLMIACLEGYASVSASVSLLPFMSSPHYRGSLGSVGEHPVWYRSDSIMQAFRKRNKSVRKTVAKVNPILIQSYFVIRIC